MSVWTQVSRLARAINNLGVGSKDDPLIDHYDQGDLNGVKVKRSTPGQGCILRCDSNGTARYQAVSFWGDFAPNDRSETYGLGQSFPMSPLACFAGPGDFCKMQWPSGNYPDDPTGRECRKGADTSTYYTPQRWQQEICDVYDPRAYTQYSCQNTTACEGSYTAPRPTSPTVPTQAPTNQTNNATQAPSFLPPITEIDYGPTTQPYSIDPAGFAGLLVVPVALIVGASAYGLYKAYQYFSQSNPVAPAESFREVEAPQENPYESIKAEPIYETLKEANHSLTPV